MNEVKKSDRIRVELGVTEDLQHAVARTYGLAVVELTRQHYYNFIYECVHFRVQEMKNDQIGFITGKKIGINDTDKIASTLAGANFSPNDYHRSIQDTARILVDAGMGDWKYYTQWSSGTCVYWSPNKKKSVSVNPSTGVINY